MQCAMRARLIHRQSFELVDRIQRLLYKGVEIKDSLVQVLYEDSVLRGLCRCDLQLDLELAERFLVRLQLFHDGPRVG